MVCGCDVVLRNEPISELPAFFLQASEGGESFVKGTVVGGAVAEEESEALLIDAVFGEAIVLEANGALLKPIGLRHLVDQEFLGGASGLMIGGDVLVAFLRNEPN